MIVDMHAHAAHMSLYPEGVLHNLQTELSEKMQRAEGVRLRPALLRNLVTKVLDDPHCHTLAAQMDDAGIEKAVLLVLDFLFEGPGKPTTDIAEIHRVYHDIARAHGDRFRVFAGIDPRRGTQGIELFEKSIRDYGFHGLKLYPPTGFELDDPELMPYLELCDSYGLPVLTHTGPSFRGMRENSRYPASMLKISGWFKRVKFVLGHAALLGFETGMHIAAKRDNVYLEVSGFQKIMHDVAVIRQRFQTLCHALPDKIVFGTDWPMFSISGTQKDWVDYFVQISPVGSKYLEMFFHENAMRILGENHDGTNPLHHHGSTDLNIA